MAIDMGGPYKAAYVFATGALIEGNAAPITAAMIGGMIPLLAIATAMLNFRRKFTKEQRGSIIPNYVMGMSFITEGAIPFAAAESITCYSFNDDWFRYRWRNCFRLRFSNYCHMVVLL